MKNWQKAYYLTMIVCAIIITCVAVRAFAKEDNPKPFYYWEDVYQCYLTTYLYCEKNARTCVNGFEGTKDFKGGAVCLETFSKCLSHKFTACKTENGT